ncbi:MAG: hypothetical protein ACI4XF_06085 [Oscillospiraceae bacterium]
MKTITLHKDYYNNITAEELESVYSIGRFMRRFEIKNMVLLVFLMLFEIYVVSKFIVRAVNCGLNTLLKNDPLAVLDALGSLAAAVLLVISCIFGIYEYRKWKYFFFGKGKIISVKNELIENSRKHPDGYYRNTLSIAVSEEEAVSVYYISDAPLDEELYIGREAIAVYFPYVHIRFAVMTGESAAEYARRYGDAVMERKNRGSIID